MNFQAFWIAGVVLVCATFVFTQEPPPDDDDFVFAREGSGHQHTPSYDRSGSPSVASSGSGLYSSISSGSDRYGSSRSSSSDIFGTLSRSGGSDRYSSSNTGGLNRVGSISTGASDRYGTASIGGGSDLYGTHTGPGGYGQYPGRSGVYGSVSNEPIDEASGSGFGADGDQEDDESYDDYEYEEYDYADDYDYYDYEDDTLDAGVVTTESATEVVDSARPARPEHVDSDHVNVVHAAVPAQPVEPRQHPETIDTNQPPPPPPPPVFGTEVRPSVEAPTIDDDLDPFDYPDEDNDITITPDVKVQAGDSEVNVVPDHTVNGRPADSAAGHADGMGTKPLERNTSFFAQPGILAAVVGGAVVGLLCAILLVMLIVYRMRKKDEGSYPLDEPKRSLTGNTYSKNYNKEFYA